MLGSTTTVLVLLMNEGIFIPFFLFAVLCLRRFSVGDKKIFFSAFSLSFLYL